MPSWQRTRQVEIAAMLASLGVGVIPSKTARQLLLQFLMVHVKERITAVSQIGWHRSAGAWVFVLPDETIVPTGFAGARAVLQTASLHVQHGLDVSGTVEQWIEEVATPIGRQQQRAPVCGTSPWPVRCSVGERAARPLSSLGDVEDRQIPGGRRWASRSGGGPRCRAKPTRSARAGPRQPSAWNAMPCSAPMSAATSMRSARARPR